MVVFRFRPGELPEAPQSRREPIEPAAQTILSALPSSWLVVRGDEVVGASPSATALGLVRDGAVASTALRRLVSEVRADGLMRETELSSLRHRGNRGRVDLWVRAAPLPGDLLLVLVEDRSEAQRIDDVRRDFVANVSHELKTPVGALSLLAEAVQAASDDPDAVRRFSGRMQIEAVRLSNLVNELIDLSRLQGDDPLTHASVVHVDDVVAEAVDGSQMSAQAKEIELIVGGDRNLTIYGDSDQLVMALRNLISNAINYSPAGTRVAIAARQAVDIAEISVTDQGIGIPQRDLDRIFERFYRVDPARSRATGGTGLGLSIVKHVCANHGGEVSVWSVEGSGSTFTLRLPLHVTRRRSAARPPQAGDVDPQPPLQVAASATSRSSRRAAQ
jgi:two-component system sensor histidine kinase SenX3